MNFYEQLFCRGRTTGEGMTHFERLFAAKFGGSLPPEVREYTGAVPVTITADGTPLLDYLITGNTVQDGTPTPDNPIMPKGCGERTGNLLDENTSSDADATHINYNKSAPIILTAGQTYTFSCNTTCNGLYIRSAADDSNLASVNNSSTMTYTPQVNVSAYCRVWNTNGITNLKPMLNTGSTALPYEPYGYKIPISSANTTTPVYLGEAETTRKIKKYEFTGQENWDKGTYAFYRVMTGIAAYKPVSCTHYQYYEGASSGAPIDSISTGSGGGMAVWIKTQNHDDTTIEQWKAYLAAQYAAGTPVTVWYVLATPETAVVNEPLMRIGDYADTLSKAQAGVEIPTNNGSTTVDVGTTLKPSEVYIKYMG